MSTLFRALHGPPTVGLFAVNMRPTVRPAELADIAVLAEDLGYDSIWAGEHPVLPDPPGPHSPFAPRLELNDPLITLACLAGGGLYEYGSVYSPGWSMITSTRRAGHEVTAHQTAGPPDGSSSA